MNKIKLKKLYNYIIHYNPFTKKWAIFLRENTGEYFNYNIKYKISDNLYNMIDDERLESVIGTNDLYSYLFHYNIYTQRWAKFERKDYNYYFNKNTQWKVDNASNIGKIEDVFTIDEPQAIGEKI